VPLPVPDKLFWSITVYDAQTRTDQRQAGLRSLIELTPDVLGDADHAGKGWFVYFRIYGPDAPAFDSSWQLPDFERLT